MNLLNLLMGSMTNDASLSALAGKTGIANQNLSKLIKAAIPVLLKFLTQNAGAAGGAQSLLTALAGHKDTRSMAQQIEGADSEDGGKILSHILGSEKESVINSLAKESELEASQVASALSNVTPALMSGLSAATSSAAKVNLSDGLDLSDLMGMFGGAASGGASSGAGGLLGGLLGGAGKATAGIGGILGGLFGGDDKDEKKDDGPDGADLLGMLTSLMK